MPNYSINKLEALVQEGKFKKKIVKSTYMGEYLSRLYSTVKASALFGGIIGGGLEAFGLSLVGHKVMGSNEIYTYSDAGGLALMGGLCFGIWGGVLGSMPIFLNWKEEAKPYVDAGGKIIYKERGLKFKKESYTLPANHQINPSQKIDWNLPLVLSPADLNTMFDP